MIPVVPLVVASLCYLAGALILSYLIPAALMREVPR
jgi:hypothetical protein